jgi:hypothetical protein
MLNILSDVAGLKALPVRGVRRDWLGDEFDPSQHSSVPSARGIAHVPRDVRFVY